MNPTADYVPLISLPIEWEWALMKTGQILAICILLLISLAFLLRARTRPCLCWRRC